MDPTARFQRCIGIVCGPSIEGGFVNDPRDPGGATNHGITIATLSHWRGRPCTVQDVQALQLSEAMAIYRAQYWSAVAGDALPAGLDLMAFDCAVNMGPGTAARLLQESVDAVVDGHVGPNTIRAAAATDTVQAIHHMAELRRDAYRAMAGWPTYGRGWTSRVAQIEDQAKTWASQ